MSEINNFSDYASKNNANQDAEKISSSKDSVQKSTLMRSGADALKKAADALNNDELWEKKRITMM